MMDKWKVCKTSRGLRLIDSKGYTYCKDRHVGDRSYWRCDHRPFKCKARASILGSFTGPNKGQIISNYVIHAHDPPTDTSNNEEKQHPSNAPSPSPSTSSMKSILKPQNVPASTPATTSTSKATPAKPIIIKSVKSTSSGTTAIADSEAEVCLRWNSHHSNMQSSFPSLMDKEQYVDVTLAAEGNLIKCHKLILSSCSSYFDEMLKTAHPFQHPIIFLQNMEFWQVKSLVEFMYKGEVNVDQTKLESLLQAAEALQIKGLAGKSQVKKEEPEEKEPPAPETFMEESLEDYLQPDSPNYVVNPGDEEEFKPYYYYKKKLKKTKAKKKVPAPGQLKTVPCNLRGTKSRPIIKQPVFYDPDFPDHDPSRSVSPPTKERDPIFHIDHVKLEPIDIEMPNSPYYETSETTDERDPLEKVTQEKLPLIVELRSGKEVDFDEPPTKKPSMMIQVIKNSSDSEAPITIEKVKKPSDAQLALEQMDESGVQVTVEKIVPDADEKKDSQDVQKKFCIRVVKMNQLNGKTEETKIESPKMNFRIKKVDSTEPPPLVTVKKFALETGSSGLNSPKTTLISKFDSNNPPPLVKVTDPKELPSTSKQTDLGFKKIRLATTESVLQKIAKTQLTTALELQENTHRTEGVSILKRNISSQPTLRLSTEGKENLNDEEKGSKNMEIDEPNLAVD